MIKENFSLEGIKINKELDKNLINIIKNKINKDIFFNDNKINLDWLEDEIFVALDQIIEFDNLVNSLESYVHDFDDKEIKEEDKENILKKFINIIDINSLKILN